MSNKEDVKVGQESYADKYAIPRITLGAAMAEIEMMMLDGRGRGVVCLISEAGEGKTQSVHALARKHGYRLIDIRTANFSLMGAGVPQRATPDGFFKIAVPDDLPKPGEKCIILFDELNQGQQHAINMFVPLIEDRRLFNYHLPDETFIIACMNPATNGYQVSKLESNKMLNRRLKKFFVYTPFSEWEKHAKSDDFHHSDKMQKPCHPWVLRFLNTTRNSLYTKTEAEKGQQFACPATWQTVSLDLYELEQHGVALDGDRASNLLASSIGVHLAKQVTDFIKHNELRISPEEILTKYKPNSRLRKRIQEMMKEEGGGIPELIDNLAAYVIDNKPAPAEVASSFALFWSDLPGEQMLSLYHALGAHAKSAGDSQQENKNTEYSMALTRELMNDANYKSVNDRILSALDDMSKRMTKGGKDVKDPMK